MRLFFRVAALAQFALLAAACSGGNSPSLPAREPLSQTQVNSQAQIREAGAPRFTATQLPAGFVPLAIMRNGRIAGYVGNDAAVYFHGSIRDLGTYPGASARALFVNSSGVAVGFAYGMDSPGSRAVLFSHGTVQDLGRLPAAPGQPPNDSDAAEVISDNGAIYGQSSPAEQLGDCPQLAKFVPGQEPTALRPTPAPGAFKAFVARGIIQDINATGEFAVYRCFGDAPFGPLAAIGFDIRIHFQFHGRAAAATVINDRGDFAGYVGSGKWDAPFQTYWQVYLQTSSTLKLLPIRGEYQTDVTGLNDRDEMIAGGFLYEHGTLYDLQDLLPGFGSIAPVRGLSNDGSFVVWGSSSGRYYLVTPSGSKP
jgi:hypothetical protein